MAERCLVDTAIMNGIADPTTGCRDCIRECDFTQPLIEAARQLVAEMHDGQTKRGDVQ